MSDQSKVIKCNNFEWDGVERKDYKKGDGCYKDIHRFSLLGEQYNEQELNFQTRYFEIQRGGWSSLEHHRHPHSVIIIRGSGKVILGDNVRDIGLHDVVYIAPDTLHQFQAGADEPLGFICIVDRHRDRPQLPDEEELKNRIPDAKTREVVKR